jgi:predicted GTPase
MMADETGCRRTRIVILGAAGRDFHNFNMLYRDDPASEVVAFTATQIPDISGRRYPPSLAGKFYPDGIPIVDEVELETLCRRERVDRVLFAYSDVTHETVMHLASRAMAAGTDFVLAGPRRTMLESRRPVIAVSAVRTGCGKSQVARWLSGWLRETGYKVAVIRHPMPYGDLAKQAVQRFETMSDIDRGDCTIEEREEYEPHVRAGNVIYAGVDYATILARAEAEADIILWDGGNNDFPFIYPNLHLVLVDALRPHQLTTYHPGETVLRMADAVIVNKVDAAASADVQQIVERVGAIMPTAKVLRAASPVKLEDPDAVVGHRVVIVEDGPTITHGGMPYGAGYVAVASLPGVSVVDPRSAAAPAIAAAYNRYSHIGPVLPALGYGNAEVMALAETLEAVDADVIVSATPIDLAALVNVSKPIVRVRYEYADAGEPTLRQVVGAFLAHHPDLQKGGKGC